MNKVIIYRNIAYFCALLLIIGLFIDIKDPDTDAIFELVYDILALITFTFAFLWIKRTVLLIGLIFYTIDFNIDLIFNPLLPAYNQVILTSTLKWIGIGFNLLGYICLLLGFWNKFDNKFLISEPRFRIKSTLIFIVVATLITQIALRFN